MNLEEFRRLYKALEEASIDNCKTPLQSLNLHTARSEYQCEQLRAKHREVVLAIFTRANDEGYYLEIITDWLTDITLNRDGTIDLSYFDKYNIMVYGDEETINRLTGKE